MEISRRKLVFEAGRTLLGAAFAATAGCSDPQISPTPLPRSPEIIISPLIELRPFQSEGDNPPISLAPNIQGINFTQTSLGINKKELSQVQVHCPLLQPTEIQFKGKTTNSKNSERYFDERRNMWIIEVPFMTYALPTDSLQARLDGYNYLMSAVLVFELCYASLLGNVKLPIDQEKQYQAFQHGNNKLQDYTSYLRTKNAPTIISLSSLPNQLD